ncbi:MAG TPA: AAA family ATPase [Aldersonia sp.]
MLGLLLTDAGPPRRRLVLVGGVPGAGKTTLLARFAGRPGVRVIDPDTDRVRLASALPTGTPYRSYRGLVHVLHYLRVLVAVLLPGGDVLVVHDPATRPRRRELLAWFARRRGWDPALLYLDVEAETALTGQHDRGRVLNRESFARHWARWSEQRPAVAAAQGARFGAWSRVDLVDRERAPQLLEGLVATARRDSRVAG